MGIAPPPPVDERKASDLVAELQTLVRQNVGTGWPDHMPTAGAAPALVQAFARYCELILDCMNRVGKRNQLAFFTRLGNAPRPAQAAGAPLTFKLSNGATSDVRVPAGSQVATVPPSGGQPVVFETERDLIVSTAALDSVFVKDPEADRFSDHSHVIYAAADPPVSLFAGTQPVEHVLCLAHADCFGARPVGELSVVFDIEPAAAQGALRSVVWELRDAQRAIPLRAESDSTAGLLGSGAVVFRNVPTIDRSTRNGVVSRWLCARLYGPVPAVTRVRSVTFDRTLRGQGLKPDVALANANPVDLSKDFHPFGERPRRGDVLHLGHAAALSLRGALVKLSFTSANQEQMLNRGDSSETPFAQVTWEAWNGSEWLLLGVGRTGEDQSAARNQFRDTTRALTRSGVVEFMMPVEPQQLTVSGVANYWIRARLTAGSYGEEARYVTDGNETTRAQYTFKPPTLLPPLIESVELEYSLQEASIAPDAVLARDDFTWRDGTADIRLSNGAFEVFRPSSERRSALYVGLTPTAQKRPPASPFSLHLLLADQENRSTPETVNGTTGGTPTVVWEYWNGQQWDRLSVRDLTRSMTRSGSVDLLVPSDMTLSEEFGRSRYWMRALWRGASTDDVLTLRRLLFNTVMASNKVSIRNEVLGSGNGMPHQRVRAAHGGILANAVLEVREADWLAWEEVAHFADSDPDHRHYVLDHSIGEVRFGNGIHGKVPPAGRGNIRFSLYATGGGRAGNVSAGSITQMRSAIPYVEQITNPTPAHGGADMETLEQFAARAPAVLRHRHRAVTAQDFEDLAELASPAVARARCLPCIDLSLDPDAIQVHPGATTVIVVPRSEQRQPLPSLELLNQVKTFLDERCSPVVTVIAHGPEYLTIDVDAEIVIDSLDQVSETEAAMRRAIDAFLHPLSGAHDGAGWAFGRRPHRSDVYGLLSRIEGINHIRSVCMRYRGRSGLGATRHFLVSAGNFRGRFFLS